MARELIVYNYQKVGMEEAITAAEDLLRLTPSPHTGDDHDRYIK